MNSSRTILRRRTAIRKKDISNVKFVEFPRHTNAEGEIVVLEESGGLPHPVTRLFTLRAKQNVIRGRHAHRECSQLMLCVDGIVEVECDDGSTKRTFELGRPDIGLFIPPSIWASVRFRHENAILIVVCDRPHEESDYIRDYAAFLAWRNEA